PLDVDLVRGVFVQPALLGLGVLPPPAARPQVLAGSGWARARGATDAAEAAVVQRVVEHVAAAQITTDLAFAPFGQRIELPQAGSGLELPDRQVRARHRLRAPQAGDPGVLSSQGACERLHL